jgi:multidrug efflux pump subunit AcrB
MTEIGSLARIEERQTYSALFRTARQPSVTVSMEPQPKSREALIRRLAGLEEGANLLSISALREGQREILLVFGLAVCLIYLVLGAQFESANRPLLLLFSLPLSLSGSLVLLFLTGRSLNLNSFLGVLILIGTTINAPIILMTGYGAGGYRRILNRSLERLLPVLATVLTTVIALLPVALNRTPEGRAQTDMAVAVIGGLVTGTLATLLVFPSLFHASTKNRDREGDTATLERPKGHRR